MNRKVKSFKQTVFLS